jgi:hypothetical protein
VCVGVGDGSVKVLAYLASLVLILAGVFCLRRWVAVGFVILVLGSGLSMGGPVLILAGFFYLRWWVLWVSALWFLDPVLVTVEEMRWYCCLR